MSELATIAVGFNIDASRATRDRLAESAFDLAEEATRAFLPIEEFGVETVVERGSIDVFVTVAVTVQGLLTVLTAYGSAAAGLERLKAEIKAMRTYFVKELPHSATLPEAAFETSRLTMEELARISDKLGT